MTDPMTQIPELVRHRREREAQILDMVRGGMAGVDDLMGRIYGESSERRLWLARHQVVSHLKKLEDEGACRCRGRGGGLPGRVESLNR